MTTFDRTTAAELELHPEYRWANTRFDLATETERRASFAILEALFRVDSLREYLRTEYDIGLFVNADDKVFVANVSPKSTATETDARKPMPKMSMEQKAEIRVLLNLSTGNPDHAYNAIMASLGQDDDMVSLATPADIRAVTVDKARLDA